MLPTRRHSRTVWDSPLDLLNDLDTVFRGFPTVESQTGVYPVDIREDANSFHVEAELPGFTKDQIDVTLENGVLSITAERTAQTPEDEKSSTHLRERRYTRVARRFALPHTLDDAKVDAKLDHGVLHLTIAKREEVKPRRITVS